MGLFGGLASFLCGLIVVLFVPLYLAALPEQVVNWVVSLPRRGGTGDPRGALRGV